MVTTESGGDASSLPVEGGGRGEEGTGGGEGAGTEPELKPFFTLIEDANTLEYHHPTVHYIFSDDDPEFLTEASLRALETGSNAELSPSREHEGSRQSGLLPPPIPGFKERYIILDMENTPGDGAAAAAAAQIATSAGTTGTTISTSPATQQQQQQSTGHSAYRVTSAHSLTPDWQILNTQLSPAPTFDTPNDLSGDPASTGGGALMLRVEGTAGFPRDVPSNKERDKQGRQSLEEMMEQFEKRMGELRRVIEVGEEGCPLRPPELNKAGDFDDSKAPEEGDQRRASDESPSRREEVSVPARTDTKTP